MRLFRSRTSSFEFTGTFSNENQCTSRLSLRPHTPKTNQHQALLIPMRSCSTLRPLDFLALYGYSTTRSLQYVLLLVQKKNPNNVSQEIFSLRRSNPRRLEIYPRALSQMALPRGQTAGNPRASKATLDPRTTYRALSQQLRRPQLPRWRLSSPSVSALSLSL
jgi:hypothetical protein